MKKYSRKFLAVILIAIPFSFSPCMRVQQPTKERLVTFDIYAE